MAHVITTGFSGKVQIKRTCGFCKRKWSIDEEVRSSEVPKGFGLEKQVKEAELKAAIQYQKNAEQMKKSPSKKGVICPRCHSLAQETIDEFFPNGFKQGFIDLFKAQLSGWVAFFYGFFILFLLSGSYLFFTKEYSALIAMSVIISLILVFLLYNIIKHYSDHKLVPDISESQYKRLIEKMAMKHDGNLYVGIESIRAINDMEQKIG